jgi:heme-degrading monooxygenase HmoA
MNFKVVSVFKLQPGKAVEEIERCRSEQSMLNMLKGQPGFLSYEVVKLSEESTMTISSWESRVHFGQAIHKVNLLRQAVTAGRENLVVSFENFSGDVVITS